MTQDQPTQSSTSAIQAPGFPSFDSLRAAHSEMLKQFRHSSADPEMGKAIQDFIVKAQATGALIDSENDRMAAQSLIDYWATHLYRMNVVAPETTLAEFDSNLAPDLPDSLCPYRGLNAFGETDAGVFYGRQRLVKALVKHLENSRLLCVVGPSGSGKSSAVRAGLVPALKNGDLKNSQDCTFLPIMVPGSKPLNTLARIVEPQENKDKSWERNTASALADDPMHLVKLCNKNFSNPVVIVVDQFEETFTLCTSDYERKAFVDNLVNLTLDPKNRHIVIMTMRTDFENKVSLLPDFQPLFEQNLVRVMPLNASELRSAVEEPAKKIGLKFEEGVVDALLSDILGEPAALPLLQFTLLRLWDLRDHNRITWESFRRLGGARQALAKSADDFYNNLIPEEQRTAKRILLRLVRPGEGLEITSNRVLRCDLYYKAEAIDRIERVLEKFVKARLLRLTRGAEECDDQVEVAHEALVRNWPTLVNWLEEERVNIRERQRLTTAAERWQTLNQDPSALLRGVLLEEAQSYEDLNNLETAFLQASEAALQAEKDAEEAVRQRELNDARRIAEESEARRKAEEERAHIAEQANRQLNRRNRIITAIGFVAFVAAVIALIATGFAVSNANQAVIAKDSALNSFNTAVVANVQLSGQNATIAAGATIVAAASTQENIQRATAEAAKAIATQQQAVILAATQTVAVQATAQAQTVLYAQQQSELASSRLGDQALSVANSQPDLGLLLAVESITGTVSFEGQGKLLDAMRTQPRLKAYLRDGSSAVAMVAFTQPDGNLVSASEDGTIRVWDTVTRNVLLSFPLTGFAQLNSFAYNAPTGLLAAGGCAVFDFSGRCTRGLIRLTTLEGENAPSKDIDTQKPGAITSLAFNANGTQLISGAENGVEFVWSVPSLNTTQTDFKPIYTYTGHKETVYSVAFNPSGSLVASAGADGKLYLRNLSDPNPIPTNYIPAKPQPIYSLAFSPDGKYLIFGREDGTLLALNISTKEIQFQVTRHVSAILSIAFANSGQSFASTSKDGSVILWNLDTLLRSQGNPSQAPVVTLSGHTSAAQSVAFSANGQSLASGSRDRTIILWSVPELPRLVLASHSELSTILSMAFSSPSGDTLHIAESNYLAVEFNYLDAIGTSNPWEYASPARSYSSNVLYPFYDSNASLLGIQTDSPASNRRTLGVDVSEANGEVDWKQVKLEGYSFACAKASDGATTQDAAFQVNWQGIGANGLIRCAVHVFRIGESPEAQAQLFLDTAKLESSDLPPVLEVLELGGTSTSSVLVDIQSWLEIVEKATGKKPILRTSPNLWSRIIELDINNATAQQSLPQLGAYPLWVVDYTDTFPVLPTGWANWVFWQYTDKQRSSGITPPFFISRFNGNQRGLDEYVTNQTLSIPNTVNDTIAVVDALTTIQLGPNFPVQNFSSVALSADGARLAVGLTNGTISIYDAKTASKLFDDFTFGITAVTSLAYSPDGNALAAGFDDGRLIYIDLSQNPLVPETLTGHIGKIFSLAFAPQDSPYGPLLASSGSDGNVFLWDLTLKRPAGQPLRTPLGTAITALAFHPKKLILASGTASGEIFLWNADPGSWKTLACELAGRNLTESEWQRFFPSQSYRLTCPSNPSLAGSSSAP